MSLRQPEPTLQNREDSAQFANPRPERTPVLIVEHDGHEVQRVTLERRITTVGRLPQNDIVLDADGVSRRHLQIINVRGECLLEDLGSRNGTFVNNSWRRVCELRHGDEMAVAKFRLRFERQVPGEETVRHPGGDMNSLIRRWAKASAPAIRARHATGAACPSCGQSVSYC